MFIYADSKTIAFENSSLFKSASRLEDILELHTNLSYILAYASGQLDMIMTQNQKAIDTLKAATQQIKNKATDDELQLVEEQPACINLDSDEEEENATDKNHAEKTQEQGSENSDGGSVAGEEEPQNDVISINESDDEEEQLKENETIVKDILNDVINSLFPKEIDEEKENAPPSEDNNEDVQKPSAELKKTVDQESVDASSKHLLCDESLDNDSPKVECEVVPVELEAATKAIEVQEETIKDVEKEQEMDVLSEVIDKSPEPEVTKNEETNEEPSGKIDDKDEIKSDLEPMVTTPAADDLSDKDETSVPADPAEVESTSNEVIPQEENVLTDVLDKVVDSEVLKGVEEVIGNVLDVKELLSLEQPQVEAALDANLKSPEESNNENVVDDSSQVGCGLYPDTGVEDPLKDVIESANLEGIDSSLESYDNDWIM